MLSPALHCVTRGMAEDQASALRSSAAVRILLGLTQFVSPITAVSGDAAAAAARAPDPATTPADAAAAVPHQGVAPMNRPQPISPQLRAAGASSASPFVALAQALVAAQPATIGVSAAAMVSLVAVLACERDSLAVCQERSPECPHPKQKAFCSPYCEV